MSTFSKMFESTVYSHAITSFGYNNVVTTLNSISVQSESLVYIKNYEYFKDYLRYDVHSKIGST